MISTRRNNTDPQTSSESSPKIKGFLLFCDCCITKPHYGLMLRCCEQNWSSSPPSDRTAKTKAQKKSKTVQRIRIWGKLTCRWRPSPPCLALAEKSSSFLIVALKPKDGDMRTLSRKVCFHTDCSHSDGFTVVGDGHRT